MKRTTPKKAVRKKAPRTCPKCGGTRVVRIIYGYPDGALAEKAERGEVELGGCAPDGDEPRWACVCGHRFGGLSPSKPTVDSAGEDMSKYKSVGEWYAVMKGRVPIQMAAGLDRLMQEEGLTFTEAYARRLKSGNIIPIPQGPADEPAVKRKATRITAQGERPSAPVRKATRIKAATKRAKRGPA